MDFYIFQQFYQNNHKKKVDVELIINTDIFSITYVKYSN